MLIHNIDTADHLSNGCLGKVVGFESGSDHVNYVMTEFLNDECGKRLRQKREDLVTKYPRRNATPISCVEFSYSLANRNLSASSSAKDIQFPVRLASAATAHKFQGQIVLKPRKMILDFHKLRNEAQGYVMLSRVQELDQVFILESFPNEKSVAHPLALQEHKRMNEVAVNTNLSIWKGKSKIKWSIIIKTYEGFEKR